ALDRVRQLTLVERLRAGDATRDDLARLGDVALQGGEVLVVDGLHALCREAAEFLASGKAAHFVNLCADFSSSDGAGPRSAGLRRAPRCWALPIPRTRPRRKRKVPRGCHRARGVRRRPPRPPTWPSATAR